MSITNSPPNCAAQAACITLASTMNDKIGLFSFFAGAGFLDLGFEKTGHYETLFVNEFHQTFSDIYEASRKKMQIAQPMFGHQVGDIADNLSRTNSSLLAQYINEARRTHSIIGFIGGPPCPDFSVGGKNRGHEGDNGKL